MVRKTLAVLGSLALVVVIAVVRHAHGRSGLFTDSNNWGIGFLVAAGAVALLWVIVGVWRDSGRFAAYRAALRRDRREHDEG